MSDIIKPYLCMGTFMTQLLRFVNAETNPKTRQKGNKDLKAERWIYEGLINVYHMKKVYLGEGTLKAYASDVKSCKESRAKYADFTDHDVLKDFEADINKKHSQALEWMRDFVSNYLTLNTKVRKARIVKIMLYMLSNDPYITPSQKLYISGDGKSISQKELDEYIDIKIEALLLGVLHFIIKFRAESNEDGADTIKAMGKDDYNDSLENYVLPANAVITLIGRSGISEKESEKSPSQANEKNNSSDNSDNNSNEKQSGSTDSKENNEKGSDAKETKNPTHEPSMIQSVDKQLVINTKPVFNIDTIKTFNMYGDNNGEQ